MARRDSIASARSPHLKAPQTAVPEMGKTVRKASMRQQHVKVRRARAGQGSVYRPKFRKRSGEQCLGNWRVKFSQKNPPTNQIRWINEVVPNCTSQTAAVEYLKRRMAEVAREKWPTDNPEAPLTYEVMRADLLIDYELNARKSLIVRSDGTKTICNLERLDAAFNGCLASEIGDGVNRLKIEMGRAGFANATINLTLALLSKMFRIAVAGKKLGDDEVPQFVKLKVNNARRGFLEHQDFGRLRKALPERLRGLLTLAYFSGMRWSEIRKLKWESVDLLRKKVRLDAGTTKNDEARVIPLIGELSAFLEVERARALPGASIYVFTNDGLRPLRTIRKAWTSACVRVGLGRFRPTCKVRTCDLFNQPVEDTTHVCSECGAKLMGKKYFGLLFHDLRRSAVRNLVRAHVPESIAMRISGHRTGSIFQRYNIIDEADVDEAGRKLESYLTVLTQREAKMPLSAGNGGEMASPLIH